MDDTKRKTIQTYVNEQVSILKKEILDPDNYKKNPYPDQVDIIQTIKEEGE